MADKEYFKKTIKLDPVLNKQLIEIKKIKGFNTDSEAIRATIRFYHEQRIDTGENHEDSLDHSN